VLQIVLVSGILPLHKLEETLRPSMELTQLMERLAVPPKQGT
jgi:hypothetical protein